MVKKFPWRSLNTGPADGPQNMAIDEAILRSVTSAESPPTVRMYTWKPAAISVGYGQRVRRDIDIEGCRLNGTAVVRRLTGGRAVLHDEELTYSVIAPEEDSSIGGSTQETYRQIGRALVLGLRHIGVHAELERAATGHGRNPSCFSSTGRYEVVVNGRKLIGSAQRRLDGIVLQHGSLLTGDGYRRLDTFLKTSNHTPSRQRIVDHVVTLSDILGSIPPFDQMADALHRGFEEALDCQLIEGELSENERTLAQQLRIDRYEKDEWNLGKE